MNDIDFKRRDFLADSAKISAGLALFSGGLLFGAGGNAIDSSADLGANPNANPSANRANQMPSFTLNNGVLCLSLVLAH